MTQNWSVKALANESDYPFIVELAVAENGLDVALSHRIMRFHRSRNIEARHGRRIIRENQIYFRWCFLDLATACTFTEQFGGDVLQPEHEIIDA